MRILPVSDLHFEFHRDGGVEFVSKLASDDVDVLVVAGDLSSARGIGSALDLLCSRFKQVVIVLGNHEFYNSNFSSVCNSVRASVGVNKNLHWLNNNKVTIDGVTFVGTTLWFERPNSWAPKDKMNDYRLIDSFEEWVYEENKKAKNFLLKEINEGDIVITHYLPSPKSIHPIYVGNPLNPFFLCDVEDIIKDRKPKYWIHGHTHSSANYMIGECNVICNPFGYAAVESNKEFSSLIRIDLATDLI